MVFGGQFVMMHGTSEMHMLLADSWDILGLCRHQSEQLLVEDLVIFCFLCSAALVWRIPCKPVSIVHGVHLCACILRMQVLYVERMIQWIHRQVGNMFIVLMMLELE